MIATCCTAPGMMLNVAGEAVTPRGSPETETVTADARPFTPTMYTVQVCVPPLEKERLVGVAAIRKSAAGVGGVGVGDPEPPEPPPHPAATANPAVKAKERSTDDTTFNSVADFMREPRAPGINSSTLENEESCLLRSGQLINASSADRKSHKNIAVPRGAATELTECWPYGNAEIGRLQALWSHFFCQIFGAEGDVAHFCRHKLPTKHLPKLR